jgi:hypothetical protein
MNRNMPCQYLISISCLYYRDAHNRRYRSRISHLQDPAALLSPSEFSAIARRVLTPASPRARSHLQNRVTLALRGELRPHRKTAATQYSVSAKSIQYCRIDGSCRRSCTPHSPIRIP